MVSSLILSRAAGREEMVVHRMTFQLAKTLNGAGAMSTGDGQGQAMAAFETHSCLGSCA